MSLNDDIKKAIQTLAGEVDINTVVCKVSNIDTTKNTCTCTPIDGTAEILGVRLMAGSSKGFLIIPKDNSIVIVNMINSFTGYVSMFSEVDKIYLNGDTYSGLVKIDDLVNKLNALENKVNALVLFTQTHIHSGGTISGSTGTATPLVTGNLTPTTKNDLENKNVLHG